MAIANNIRAMEIAVKKRSGATLVEIAKFLDLDKPLSRQRISQLVHKGELLLALRDDPVHVETVNMDITFTKDIALRMGFSGRVANVLGKLGYTIGAVDSMLISRREELLVARGLGIKGFNELAVYFKRPRWDKKYLGKHKYRKNAEEIING